MALEMPAQLLGPSCFPDVDQQANCVHRVAGLLQHHSAGHVRAQVAAGRWQHPERGVVVTHNGALSRDQQMRVALAAAPDGSAISGRTALELDGLRGFQDDAIHLSVPRGSRRIRRGGVITHWSGFLGPADVHPTHEPQRTRTPRSILDAATWAAGDRMARALVLAGVQQRLTTPEMLRMTLPSRGPCRRHALIAESIGDAEGGISSVPEWDFANLVRRRGLPDPTHQAVRPGADGRYYLDACWDDFDTAAEVHGTQHLALLAWDADLDRANDIVVAGPRLLQFTSYAVRRHQGRVGDLLEQALRRGGWAG